MPHHSPLRTPAQYASTLCCIALLVALGLPIPASAQSVPEGASAADANTPLPDVQTIDGFVDALNSGSTPWNEPYFDPKVQIDGDLAHVWMFFQFYEGDTFSHCGHNSIQLLHDGDTWRITFIAYTHRTTDCRRE